MRQGPHCSFPSIIACRTRSPHQLVPRWNVEPNFLRGTVRMKTNCESEKERWYGRRFKERQRCVRHIKIHVHVQTLQTIGGMKTILVAAGAYKSTDKLLFRICMILCISLSRKPRRIRCPVANIVKMRDVSIIFWSGIDKWFHSLKITAPLWASEVSQDLHMHTEVRYSNRPFGPNLSA